LTGDGADEIFAGYPRYEKSQLLPRFTKLHGKSIDNILNKERGRALGIFRKILLSQTRPESLQHWAYWHWNFPPAQLAALIHSDFKSADHWHEISSALIPYSNNQASGPIENLLYLDRAIWLSMESNRKLDRMSMHYSIEARSPFQDDRVIKAGLREMQKENFKALNKKLLWNAFPEVKKIGVRQDKTGFISPVGHWLRTNPILVKESISHLSTTGYFSNDALASYSEAANSGNYRRIMQLWSLVVFSRWLGSSANQ
jgi:asparagine synthase (glutamine-hydrolysing)